jgi:hypothetical protein
MADLKAVAMVSEIASFDLSSAIFVAPPALTRLEPRSVSGDPKHGVDAVTADALWMIGRQWQLGELLGEDCGSPVSVHVTHRSLPVTAWAPAGRVDGTDRDVAMADLDWRPWPGDALLDELVEHVPRPAVTAGLRWRAHSGSVLADMLRDAGVDDAVDRLVAACPLTLDADPNDPTGEFDPTAELLFTALDGHVADGGAAEMQLAAGTPEWVADASDPDAAGDAAAAWVSWMRGATGAGGCWTTSRLEHRFYLRFGHGADAAIVRATEFGSGAARWHHFEWLPRATATVDGDAALGVDDPRTDVLLATPLRYPGMPADRYWQLEDGNVDVGAIEAQPHDLARLCLAEFALVSGDDWLVVPIDDRVGALNQVQQVAVTDTFGDQHTIDEGADDRRRRGFRMFEVTSNDGKDTLPGMLLPPVASTPLVGEPVEDVTFLRDETANMGWAVERIVPGRSGAPRPRSAEPYRTSPSIPDGLDPTAVVYEFQTQVPRHWIPLVPTRLAPGQVPLRKGALVDEDDRPILAASHLLEPTPLSFPDEEIPREGLTVRAVPVVARRHDGSYARWTGHRIAVGRGEGSSGLASDGARPAAQPFT